jgi:hypothetical protein
MAVTSNDEPSKMNAVPRVATFFALYADPIGLVDGSYYALVLGQSTRGFPSEIALHLKDGEPAIYLDPRMHDYLFVSIRFHRGRRRQDLIAEHTSELLRVVERVGDESLRELITVAEEGPALDDEQSAYTVVEMTTPIVAPQGELLQPSSPTNEVMYYTLTRCLNELIRVLNAYRSAAKILIPAPSRERVGPMIISATRSPNPAQGVDWEVTSVINSHAVARQPMLKGERDSSYLAKAMTEYLYYESIGDPALAIGNLQNEMDVALYHDGNYRGTVMSAHSASEVLMDTALMAMLFEEGKTPEVSGSIFDKPLKSRLLTEYHERLGGSWTPQGSNAVAEWLRDVLSMRHRVAHAGYIPSSKEAEAAREAHYGLGRYLRDRLAVRTRKYPFSAGMLVTRQGFERRDIHTKAASNAIAAVTLQSLSTFTSWRNGLARYRAGTP